MYKHAKTSARGGACTPTRSILTRGGRRRTTVREMTSDDLRSIRTFLGLDRMGAALGLLVVLVVNGLVIQSALVWVIAPALMGLIGCLTLGIRSLDHGQSSRALFLLLLGNWILALVVPVVLPFLWPVMVLTTLMPVVFAAPYFDSKNVLGAVVGSTLVVGVIGATGLALDDGGALPDIDDEVELVVVVGGLMALSVPMGVIVWQTNQAQRAALARASALNRDLNRSQADLARSRRRVVEASDLERSRIERDLHDGAQQRLVALGVHLRLLEATTPDGSEFAGKVSKLVGELDSAVEEVRELAHGIYPPLLEARGLAEALEAVARRSASPVMVSANGVGRMDRSIETALYFTALEALTNATKHAPDAEVEVTLVERGDEVVLTITDRGQGFDPEAVERSHGMLNMSDRIAAIGGDFNVESSAGRGSVVTASVPKGESPET